MDPLLPLVTNLATRNREYVFFVGAGLSKDAGVKSGWDILIETLKPIYITENNPTELPENYYQHISQWYLDHATLRNLGYSEILEQLYEGDIERREYLRQFFENTQPGEAHSILAQLVKSEIIRFIFTTNFDDLLEKALDELNVPYDVIFSDDILRASKSWDKVKTCRIYKLHGDYKTGRIRNTIPELERLDPAICEDFKYIIDRHGLVVIGYAGRDKGVMECFADRKPYHYPFYWQYVSKPPNNEEFRLYHELNALYSDKHKREIHLIHNASAASFFNILLAGIENLQRIVIAEGAAQSQYRAYIAGKDAKKIRALTLELITKFESLYDESATTEDLNEFYDYKFDIFQEFLNKSQFIFYYFEELLNFDLHDEAKYLITRLIQYTTRPEIRYDYEFISKSTPYYLFMNFGSLMLKNDKLTLLPLMFEFRLKLRNGTYVPLASRVSYEGQGWPHIGQKYKILKKPKFRIIGNYLLPKAVTQQDFNRFDAFVLLYIVSKNLDYHWTDGSAFFTDDFMDTYLKYFDTQITTIDEATNLMKKLRFKVSDQAYSDTFEAMLEHVKGRFSQKQ